MRRVIRQSVILPAAADALFAMYLDPEAHAAITGAPVRIGSEPGAAFHAFDGVLSGTVLAVAAPRLIVQSWRSAPFHADDPDSTLILSFAPEGPASGRIDLVHLDVPAHDHQGVSEGWNKFYWTPWRAYLDSR